MGKLTGDVLKEFGKHFKYILSLVDKKELGPLKKYVMESVRLHMLEDVQKLYAEEGRDEE